MAFFHKTANNEGVLSEYFMKGFNFFRFLFRSLTPLNNTGLPTKNGTSTTTVNFYLVLVQQMMCCATVH